MKRTDSSPLKLRASSSASLMMTLAWVSGSVQELVDRQPQDQAIHDVHPLDPPVLGGFGNDRIQLRDG